MEAAHLRAASNHVDSVCTSYAISGTPVTYYKCDAIANDFEGLICWQQNIHTHTHTYTHIHTRRTLLPFETCRLAAVTHPG